MNETNECKLASIALSLRWWRTRHRRARLRIRLENEIPMPKVWLITGSSRGLGRALAEAVLTAGDKLVATARNPEQLADLVERFGDQVRAVALNVTNEPAAAHAVAVATEAFGRLDVLANNAGYGDISPIEDTSLDEFRAQIETNLFGVINVTKAALPLMRSNGPVISSSFPRLVAE